MSEHRYPRRWQSVLRDHYFEQTSADALPQLVSGEYRLDSLTPVHELEQNRPELFDHLPATDTELPARQLDRRRR